MHRAIPLALLILALGTLAGSQQPRPSPMVSANRSEAVRAINDASVQLAELERIHAKTVAINSDLSRLYDTLSRKVAEVGKLAETVRAGGGNPGVAGASSSGTNALLDATRQMQETQMSFNLQYLQLQENMQNANRQFTAVSNIMKSKHDTVKNSISNIR
jgi:hypothetical protein